jgi:hypothetical protein
MATLGQKKKKGGKRDFLFLLCVANRTCLSLLFLLSSAGTYKNGRREKLLRVILTVEHQIYGRPSNQCPPRYFRSITRLFIPSSDALIPPSSPTPKKKTSHSWLLCSLYWWWKERILDFFISLRSNNHNNKKQ